jgi:hypothetical protein
MDTISPATKSLSAATITACFAAAVSIPMLSAGVAAAFMYATTTAVLSAITVGSICYAYETGFFQPKYCLNKTPEEIQNEVQPYNKGLLYIDDDIVYKHYKTGFKEAFKYAAGHFVALTAGLTTGILAFTGFEATTLEVIQFSSFIAMTPAAGAFLAVCDYEKISSIPEYLKNNMPKPINAIG